MTAVFDSCVGNVVRESLCKHNKYCFKMPGRCAVPKCDSQTGGSVFPADLVLRMQWIDSLKRINLDKTMWKPTKYDVVCAKHFT